MPSALKRITQSRNVCLTIPAALASSAQLMPSKGLGDCQKLSRNPAIPFKPCPSAQRLKIDIRANEELARHQHPSQTAKDQSLAEWHRP